MTSPEPIDSTNTSKEEIQIISNRLAVALAKRESLIKSWTASSSRPTPPTKTQEELDFEDAILFRNEPPRLGVGAPIPSHFLVSEAQRNNKSLRAKFFPVKGLKASKARDAEEKAVSAKRCLGEESSDEDEGRSGLGRAKKLKTKGGVAEAVPSAAAGAVREQKVEDIPTVPVMETQVESDSGRPQGDKVIDSDSPASGKKLDIEKAEKYTEIDTQERKKIRKKEKRKMQRLRDRAVASVSRE